MAFSPSLLPALPEDLLLLIFENLAPSNFDDVHGGHATARKTLATVCLVSKPCLRIARPILYRSIDLDFTQDIVNLSKSLVLSAANTALVLHLSVEDWGYWTVQDEGHGETVYRQRPISESLRPYFEHAIQHYGSSPQEIGGQTFLESLMKGSQDAHLALCLIRCNNISTLTLTLLDGFKTTWTYAVLAQAAATSHMSAVSEPNEEASRPIRRLTSLAEISTLDFPAKGLSPLTDLDDVLRLKTLSKFQGSQINLLGSEFLLKRQSYSLDIVDLNHSIVDVPGLRSLLACCPKLSNLSISWATATEEDFELRDLRWDLIGSALRELGTGLRSLTFDVLDTECYFDCDPVFYSPVGDLCALSSLQHLDIPSVALFGMNADDASFEDRISHLEDGILDRTLPQSLIQLRVSHWRALRRSPLYEEHRRPESIVLRTLRAPDRMAKLKIVKIAGLSMSKGESGSPSNCVVELESHEDGSITTKHHILPLEY